MTHRPYDRVKRVLDLAAAATLLIATLPIQAGVALAVAVRLCRPVLFRQTRPGLCGRPFEIVKFRTMRPVDLSRGWDDDASRMTRLGQLLRSTSLDELPTLWNVIRGDMSLVGPRPLLMRYLPLYSVEQARRHEVRPGLTGLAQVSGRNAVSWPDRLRLDVDYVDRRCLRLDFQIVSATVGVVLRGTGISAVGSATMPEFMGNDLVSDKR
jgi:lipopolysaccharide/colanic/teichoic acid biosynthesis glycosyltransferase